MHNRSAEIMEELKLVVSSKTMDALLPPLIFVVVNGAAGLTTAVIISVAAALLLSLVRAFRRQPLKYAFGGLAGVLVASGFALFAGRAENYFLPKILSSAAMLAVSLVSLIAGKPLAALASHLSRGWNLNWYWRPDVKPAYREVTWLWAALFLMRLIVQINLYFSADLARMAWANLLLGTPVTLTVLVISYLYGLRRLHQLGGPGAHEFVHGVQPPWEGQTRGF